MKNKQNHVANAAHMPSVQVITLKPVESPFVVLSRAFFEIFTEQEMEVVRVYSEMKCELISK